MNEITTKINAPQTETSKRGKGFFITTGIIILGILGTFIFFYNRDTNTSLFVENFRPLPDVIVNRDEEENDLLTIGMSAYSHQDYMIAILHLEEFINLENSSESNKRNALIYIGITNLALGNINKAIHNFNKITQQNPTFREAAQWYLALAYLKQNNLENCNQQLKIIQDDKQHEYHARAENLLGKAKNLKKN
jgi:tetratricopeptide (TPR) repeat protein